MMMKKSSKGTKCSRCGRTCKVIQTALGEPLCDKCKKAHELPEPDFTEDKKD